jgi:hypothetical protein
MESCRCYHPPFDYRKFSSYYVGVHGQCEFSVVTCCLCGSRWLECLIEQEGFTGAGRWYRGLLPATGQIPAARAALDYLKSLPWYFVGGSYFHSTGMRRNSPILE